MSLTWNLASIVLACWLIAEQTRIFPVAKLYLRSVLFTGGVNNVLLHNNLTGG